MFRTRLIRHVHFSDCDPARIVFYPRYFVWFDEATEDMFRKVGINWEDEFDSEEGGFAGVPLIGAEADFQSACRMGDDIVIDTWIDEWREKVFFVRHEVRNGDRLAVVGRETRIWTVRSSASEAGIRSAPIPAAVRAALTDGPPGGA